MFQLNRPIFGLSYLGEVTYDKSESPHLGPNYEIRMGSDNWDGRSDFQWGREHHAMCAGGYRVPVLFTPYKDMPNPVREILRDVPVMLRFLVASRWRRLVWAVRKRIDRACAREVA